jgi:hypothetical protein
VHSRADADPQIDEIVRDYRKRTGRESYVFCGSSAGAWATDVSQVII